MAGKELPDLIRIGQASLREDPERALEVFTEATQRFPKSAIAWYGLALATSDPEMRRTYLLNGQKLKPDHAGIQNELSKLPNPPMDTTRKWQGATSNGAKPPKPNGDLVGVPPSRPVAAKKELEVNSEVMRILGAKLVLDNDFRERVNIIYSRYRSVAPEFGLDVELLLRISHALESEEKTTDRILFALKIVFSVCALLLIFTGGITFIGMIVAFLLTVVVRARGINRFVKRYLKRFEADTYSEEEIRNLYKDNGKTNLSDRIPAADQNFVAYSGYKPFVGAGIPLNGLGWAFPISLVPDENSGNIKPFSEIDMYNVVDKCIRLLDVDGLSIRDYVYARGRDVRLDSDYFDQNTFRPVQHLSDAKLNEIIRSHNSVARYYKWIAISTWGGELVLSFFVRFAKQGNLLFLEFTPYMLPPIAENFRDIDNVQQTTTSERLTTVFLGSLVDLLRNIFLVIQVVLRFFNRLGKPKETQLNKPSRGEIKLSAKKNLDWGANYSLREFIADKDFHHYFQQIDSQMYLKIVEKELVKTLNQFFEDHNVSTAEFGQRVQTVINNNIDNSSHHLSVEGDMVGNANLGNGVLEVSGGIVARINQARKVLSGGDNNPTAQGE